MRIIRLDLKAYGPFTERSITFASREPGLHILFGPNEAGKSSSLRALKALFYGFPERTADNFRHPNDQLLVGGCLQDEAGREIAFMRRKRRKADILSPDGSPLDAAALAHYLPAAEPALFESLYGIDHETLVRGGEDILAQKGEVGQALFAAGAGISSLHGIMVSLEVEADELFKARGSRQQINLALKEYREQKKIVRQASLPSTTWKEHRKRLREAEAEQAGLEELSRLKNAEVRRLDRLHRAIPELARLENLQQQLMALGRVVVLPPDFPEQLRQVEQQRSEIGLQLTKDRTRLQQLVARKKKIALNRALLDRIAPIEDLHQRIGEFRKGQQDRTRLEGMRISSRREAGALLRQVRPDLRLTDAESLRPMLGRKRILQNLASQYESLNRQVLRAGEQSREAETELLEITAALDGLPEVVAGEGLEQALKLARKAGDIDDRIQTTRREISRAKAACELELNKAGIWNGGLVRLQELALPLPETVGLFRDRFSELDDELRQLHRERGKSEEELAALEAEKREISRSGEIPEECDLNEMREKRNYGWLLLRRRWLDKEDVAVEAGRFAPDRPLHLAFESCMEQTDQLADRLRREADRVARAAALRAGMEKIAAAGRELSAREERKTRQREELADHWRELWQPLEIIPLSPAEMLAWIGGINTLRFKSGEISAKEREAEDSEQARRKHRQRLLHELRLLDEESDDCGNELAPLLIRTESIIDTLARNRAEREKLAARRMQVEKVLIKARQEEKSAESALIQWRLQWDETLVGLGFTGRPLPEEALELFETAARCFARLDEAEDLHKRIEGIERDGLKFSSDVLEILTEAAPELLELPPDQAALRLHALAGAARKESELLERLEEEAETVGRDIGDGMKTMTNLDGRLTTLLEIAACGGAAELAAAIEKSQEYQRLQEKISEARATLAKMSEGIPVEQIKQQAEEVAVDELPGRIQLLRREIDEELYPAIKEIAQRIGEEKRELKLMDGGAAAAEAADNLERVGARIRRLADQYTRIKLAAMVLKKEIERYREQHQDPVLKIASRYFADLTRGSFAGLRTDIDDRGEPVLIGLRPDDLRVAVEGMSSGTRDQLYLALRLATLEWRLKSHEPMPFIIDDILINFDDDRSQATLNALAGLAVKNQVILFTHHRRIVEQAERLDIGGSVHIHELRQSGPAAA